jgi:hypothetical protein
MAEVEPEDAVQSHPMPPMDRGSVAELPAADRDLANPALVLWTLEQFLTPLVAIGALVVLYLVLRFFNYDYLAMLWTHPTGVRMSITAVLSVLLGCAFYYPLCLALNWLAPPGDDRRRRLRRWLSLIVLIAFLVLFICPAVFVLLVGPAALRIEDSLLDGVAP